MTRRERILVRQMKHRQVVARGREVIQLDLIRQHLLSRFADSHRGGRVTQSFWHRLNTMISIRPSGQ